MKPLLSQENTKAGEQKSMTQEGFGGLDLRSLTS
jgi:hypothetical protein